MTSTPQPIAPLVEGDLIYITAPAKAIEKEYIDHAIEFLNSKGFRVKLGKHCLGQHHYFSGTDAERLSDLQEGIDDPEVRAIFCARGGYGCVRIVDDVRWAAMLRAPKWLVGFSDVTVFHHRLQRFGVPSLHATMPFNFKSNSDETFATLFSALKGEPYSISCPATSFNKTGNVSGKLVGGNLSIVYSLLGTDDHIDYTGTILFIEDLAEHLYHIDRMLFALRKSGVLEKIAGLVVGGMTDLEDTTIPFGRTVEEIILDHLTYRKIPVAFGFPSGHIDDNRALVFGRSVYLSVNDSCTTLSFPGI